MNNSPAVTPIFDELNREWLADHGESLFGLRLVADVSPLGEQAKLDEKLGTLPMFSDFESSFDGEFIDWSKEHQIVVLTEPEMTPGDEQDGGDDGRFRDFDTMPPADVKALPATALTSEEIAWVLLNWADLLEDKSVEQWFEASSWDAMEDLWDDECVNLGEEYPTKVITVGMCLQNLRRQMQEALAKHPQARHAHPITEDEPVHEDDRPAVQPISLIDRANRKNKK